MKVDFFFFFFLTSQLCSKPGLHQRRSIDLGVEEVRAGAGEAGPGSVPYSLCFVTLGKSLDTSLFLSFLFYKVGIKKITQDNVLKVSDS